MSLRASTNWLAVITIASVRLLLRLLDRSLRAGTGLATDPPVVENRFPLWPLSAAPRRCRICEPFWPHEARYARQRRAGPGAAVPAQPFALRRQQRARVRDDVVEFVDKRHISTVEAVPDPRADVRTQSGRAMRRGLRGCRR